MPWCQVYFGIVQIYAWDLVPELGRLASALLEPLQALERHWAACFALMFVAGRYGQLCLIDSNLAVSDENPVHGGGAGFQSRGRVGSWGFPCWQTVATSTSAFLACHRLRQYLSDYQWPYG